MLTNDAMGCPPASDIATLKEEAKAKEAPSAEKPPMRRSEEMMAGPVIAAEKMPFA